MRRWRIPPRATRQLEITRGLIVRVLVKPGETRGSFELEPEGELAALVELAQGPERNTAALDGAAIRDAFRRPVEVIAGARSQQYRMADPSRMQVLAASQALHRMPVSRPTRARSALGR